MTSPASGQGLGLRPCSQNIKAVQSATERGHTAGYPLGYKPAIRGDSAYEGAGAEKLSRTEQECQQHSSVLQRVWTLLLFVCILQTACKAVESVNISRE